MYSSDSTISFRVSEMASFYAVRGIIVVSPMKVQSFHFSRSHPIPLGLIVLPQLMNSGFFSVPYYITPGHYVYEGMVSSLVALTVSD